MRRLWGVAIIVFVSNYIINGLSFYFLLNHVNSSAQHYFLIIIVAYNLAWLIGFLTPGAPGGIGVKEIVLLFFLSPIMNESGVLMTIIYHRIILIIADLLAYMFLKLIQNKRKL